jgi:hypothetical protein
MRVGITNINQLNNLKMKIDIKFKLGDTVSFIRDNEVGQGEIVSTNYVNSINETFTKYTISREVTTGRFQGGRETFSILEERLFKTKAALIKSL